MDPDSPGLVGYWDFNEDLADQNVFDVSPMGNDGTLGASSSAAGDDPVRVVSTAPSAPVMLGEDFEDPNTIFDYSSTHAIPYEVQNTEAAHTGSYSFKAYPSMCEAECLDDYRVDLLHTFSESVRLTGVELWAQEGSTTGTAWGGRISVGHDTTWNFDWDVIGDGAPITGEWQFAYVPIDESAADVRIQIWDITSQTMMWLDDIVIYYEPTPAPPLAVVGHQPNGLANEPVNAADVAFNREIDPNTFTVDDIDMTGPSGSIPIVEPPWNPEGNVWQITFPTADAG